MTEPNSPKERRLHPRFLVEGNIDRALARATVDRSRSGWLCWSARLRPLMQV